MRTRGLIWALAMLASVAMPVGAQVSTGNIYGEVRDEQGSVLPGADVSLAATSIGGAPKTTVTDSVGQFRFINLDPGTYKLTVGLSGFTRVERDVIVTTGQNTTVDFGLKVASLEETITVTSESPVVDTKKVGTSTTISREELQATPQSKDPWALLKTVPGVIVDRVNVGGNESGQQSGFVGKGSAAADTMWNMDGVVITDTNSGGASSAYYDFNAFDEVNVSTGGNDLRVQTGGIGINFVTRRGTNAFRGTLFGTVNHRSLEANNTPDELVNDERLLGEEKANHTDQINNMGFDVGGPIVRDKLWFWGSYGHQDIRIVRLQQTKDKTLLKNKSAKVNWRPNASDDFSLFYFDGAKEKFGRPPGLVGNEADTFLWNQGNFYPGGLHGLWKGEWNHVFGSAVVVNAKYAWYGWGYGFSPRGGVDKDGVVNYDNDTAYGSYSTYQAIKPWHITDFSGSYFKSGMGANHEFKFGFGYIRRPSTSLTHYSGSQVFGVINSPTNYVAQVYRDRNIAFREENWSAYFGDTITKGNMTLNAGVRWDRQKAQNLASTAAANPTFPEILPQVTYDGAGPKIDWQDLSPRLGVTFALDKSRKTVLRGSYAMYAGQLNPTEVSSYNPVGSYYSYIAYRWVDTNRDGFIQKAEVLTNLGPLYAGSGVDPANPTALVSPSTVASDYKANHDHEIIIGADRELIPNLAVGMAYTWRRSNDWPSWNPRIGLTRANYTALSPVTFQGYTVQPYAPDQTLVDRSLNGHILSNRADYHTGFNGLEFTMTKRLSNKWMTRAAVSWNDWQEHFDGPDSAQNPTQTVRTYSGTVSGPLVEGGQVAPRSGGSGKGDIFYNAKWQFNVTGLYEMPWGIGLGANLFGRQGYARPFVIRTSLGADGAKEVLATPTIDENRYDTLWDLDLRVAKTFGVYNRVKLELSADIFNVMNGDTTLAQTRRLDASSFNAINEILSPRIMRIGARLQF